MTSFNFNYLLKDPSPNTITLGLGLQYMNGEGHTIPSITTISTLGLFIYMYFPLANLKWYCPFPYFPSTELLLAQFIFREKTYFIFILSLFFDYTT